jgi:hypothetical protein
VLISTIGGTSSFTNFGTDWDVTYSGTVIETPIYVKPRIPAGPGNLFFLVGPDIIILITDFEEKSESGVSDFSFDVEPEKTFIVGVTGGLGYEFPAGLGTVSFEAKYTRTFTDEPIIADIRKWYFNTISILVGYGFELYPSQGRRGFRQYRLWISE